MSGLIPYSAPYSADELDAKLTHLGVPSSDHMVVAVSGGADSLALAVLAAKIRPITAITIDHDLRPDSAAEALQVGVWLSRHDIHHQIIKWSGAKPASNIQALARQARYQLLGKQAAALNSRWILTGHQLDDQAETVLVRLARGSGLAGLSAMTDVANVPGSPRSSSTKLVRPLLDVPRERLVLALKAMEQEWIEDPSNKDERYDRIKARKMLENPPLEGLTSARLWQTAKSLARAQSAIHHYVDLLKGECVHFNAYGHGFIDIAALRKAPDEVALRLLADLFKEIGAGQYPPRFAKLEDMYNTLRDDMLGRTLGGALVTGASQSKVTIVRELAATPAQMVVAAGGVFDGRWQIAPDTYESVGYKTPALDVDPALVPHDIHGQKSLMQSLVWGVRKDGIIEPLADGRNAIFLLE